jgi:hypothetical protein
MEGEGARFLKVASIVYGLLLLQNLEKYAYLVFCLKLEVVIIVL